MNQPDLPALLARELAADERLLWSRQPDADRVFRSYMVAVLAFGAMLITAMIGATLWSIGDGDIAAAVFFLLFFSAMGLLLLRGFLRKMRETRRTLYAVTSDRAIIFTPSSKRQQLWARDVQTIGPVSRSMEKDDRGTLSIQLGWIATSKNESKLLTMDFEHAPDVAQAERLIHELRFAPGHSLPHERRED